MTPNPFIPGESITKVFSAKGSSKASQKVVVCRPRLLLLDMGAVRSESCGAIALRSELFPTPDMPANNVVFPAMRCFRQSIPSFVLIDEFNTGYPAVL